MNLKAFVIMPFDDEFDAVYSKLIAAPLREVGYDVNRADDVETRQNILADVVRGIAEADLVIADLTASNANVFYELGLAHAMGVPTVLIADRESANDIPFDLRQYRTEFYDTHFERAEAIAKALQKLGKAHIAEEIQFSSPISDFLPQATRPMVHAKRTGAVGTNSSQTSSDTDIRIGDSGDLEDDDDRGLLDFVDELTEGSARFIELAGGISSATETVGNEISDLATRMNAVDAETPSGQAQGRRLLLRSAGVLDAYAEQLEARLSDYETAVDRVTSTGLSYFTLLAENPAQFHDDLRASLDVSTSLRDSVAEANEGMGGFRDSVASLPPMIKQVNRARNRTVRALDAVLAQHERVRSYAEQSIHLVEQALNGVDDNESAPHSPA